MKLKPCVFLPHFSHALGINALEVTPFLSLPGEVDAPAIALGFFSHQNKALCSFARQYRYIANCQCHCQTPFLTTSALVIIRHGITAGVFALRELRINAVAKARAAFGSLIVKFAVMLDVAILHLASYFRVQYP